jgi:hypothetical protein
VEPDLPQHDSRAACVIAQQYSSITFVSKRFHCHKKKLGAPFKNVIIPFLLLSSFPKSDIV